MTWRCASAGRGIQGGVIIFAPSGRRRGAGDSGDEGLCRSCRIVVFLAAAARWPVSQWPDSPLGGGGVARALERFATARAAQVAHDVQIHGTESRRHFIEAPWMPGTDLCVAEGSDVNRKLSRLSCRVSHFRRQVAARNRNARRWRRDSRGTCWVMETSPARIFSIVEEASSRSALLGDWVRLHCGNEVVEGVGRHGSRWQLLVRLQRRPLRIMAAGEVTTRPAS